MVMYKPHSWQMITAFSFCLTVGITVLKMKDTTWWHYVIPGFAEVLKPGSVLSLEIAWTASDRGFFLTLGMIFESFFFFSWAVYQVQHTGTRRTCQR